MCTSRRLNALSEEAHQFERRMREAGDRDSTVIIDPFNLDGGTVAHLLALLHNGSVVPLLRPYILFYFRLHMLVKFALDLLSYSSLAVRHGLWRSCPTFHQKHGGAWPDRATRDPLTPFQTIFESSSVFTLSRPLHPNTRPIPSSSSYPH